MWTRVLVAALVLGCILGFSSIILAKSGVKSEWGSQLPHRVKPAGCSDTKLTMTDGNGTSYTAAIAFKCLVKGKVWPDAAIVWLSRDADDQVVYAESVSTSTDEPKLQKVDADGDSILDVVFVTSEESGHALTTTTHAVLMGPGRLASYEEYQSRDSGEKQTFGGAARSQKEKKLRAFLKGAR